MIDRFTNKACARVELTLNVIDPVSRNNVISDECEEKRDQRLCILNTIWTILREGSLLILREVPKGDMCTTEKLGKARHLPEAGNKKQPKTPNAQRLQRLQPHPLLRVGLEKLEPQ